MYEYTTAAKRAAFLLVPIAFVLGFACGATRAEGEPASPDVSASSVTYTFGSEPIHEVERLQGLAQRAQDTRVWNEAVWQAEMARRWYEGVRAHEAARAPSRGVTGPVRSPDSGQVNGFPCGGDLPPCWVLRRESGGNPTAQNPRSSASGLWQFIDSTWAGFMGYAHAKDAPPDVQNERARMLWAGGAGCGHWSACG